MAAMPESLHWSLPVPSVQELSGQKLETVPARYVREDRDEISTAASDPSLCVPLIDLSKLVNADSHEDELHKLHLACKNWGVFQLINHGALDESLSNMSKKAREFFELPLQEKKLCAQRPGSLEGYGQAFVTSEEQKLDWNDMIFLKALPAQNRLLQLWPENPQKFREALGKYSEDVRQVAVSIIGFLALSLGLETQDLSKGFPEGNYDVRMNCYPPCPEPERVLGIVPHADNSGITLLLECGDTPGLQFLKDGNWVLVEPIDVAFVVNIGQILETMSNGVYKAPEHRAVVNRDKERLSIVTFCYPNSSVDIGPAEGLTKSGNPPSYKTITNEEYFNGFFNRKLDVPFFDTLKI